MTVAIILFTQLQETCVIPSLSVPWVCVASAYHHFFKQKSSLTCSPFPREYPARLDHWCRSGGKKGRYVLGRPCRMDGVYSVHVCRLNSFQCSPTLMDENITTCRRTHHISEKKLWIWLLILRLELLSVGRLDSEMHKCLVSVYARRGFVLFFFFLRTHCHFI